jgi:hypothetical protein
MPQGAVKWFNSRKDYVFQPGKAALEMVSRSVCECTRF